MNSSVSDSNDGLAGSHRFVTTQWAMVLEASRPGDRQLNALEQLCRAYWYPLYAYVRRRGYNADDAKDLTQEFFSRLLAKSWLEEILPEGGRFRSFLLTALNRFLANEYDRTRALKRGGDCQLLFLDADAAESQYLREMTNSETPETLFERRWALVLLDQALARLRRELVEARKPRHFDLLNPFLSREPEAHEYDTAARELNERFRTGRCFPSY